MFGALWAVISIYAAEYISYFALSRIIHSPNTFSLNPLPLHVNVSEWTFFLTWHTCSTHWVFVHHPRMWQCKKYVIAFILRKRRDNSHCCWDGGSFFFLPRHSMGRCFVHLLVKGPIFTKHCSSCFESSLTYSETAWSKLRFKKKRTERTCSPIGGESIPDTCVPTVWQMRQQDFDPASEINISPAAALRPLGGAVCACRLDWWQLPDSQIYRNSKIMTVSVPVLTLALFQFLDSWNLASFGGFVNVTQV